ncbi:hypothetical protein Tco_0296234 [Tanacetum coccineum]
MGRTLLIASSPTSSYSIYKIYIDHYVPLTQSTRRLSIPKVTIGKLEPLCHPNPNTGSSQSTVLKTINCDCLRIPAWRSTPFTPQLQCQILTKHMRLIFRYITVSSCRHKSREEREARENVAIVDEHLASKEIEKMVDRQENVVDDSSIPRNDESNIPSTRIEPGSNKESPKVHITKDKEVEITDITNVVIPVNVNDEDVEIIDEVYELKRMEKGKILEETRNSPIPTPIRSHRIHTDISS